jgi:hypothetical protein
MATAPKVRDSGMAFGIFLELGNFGFLFFPAKMEAQEESPSERHDRQQESE